MMRHHLIILEEDRDVQKPLILELTLKRYIVFEASRRAKKCPQCGEYSHAGDGVTKGLSDLVVTHLEWPAYIGLLIECKGTKTRLSAEQQALADKGRIAIIREAKDGVRIVEAFDKAVRTAFKEGSPTWLNEE